MTDLIVGATAMVQRHEIEQQLFTLRLKQRCFVALAEQAPAAIFQQVEPTPAVQTPAIDLSGYAQLLTLGSAQSPEVVRNDPDHTKQPAQLISPTVTDGLLRSERCSIKLFPGAVDCPLQTQPGSTAGTPPSVASPQHENDGNNIQGTERAGVFNPMSQYTKGRYNP